MDSLQEFMVETQNQLEMCFPPAFFNMMPHLMIHMIDQIQALGPWNLHEMWTFQRFMSILNRYVLNQAYTEGSMVEGYNTEEFVECCQEYLKDEGYWLIWFAAEGQAGLDRHLGKMSVHRQGFHRYAARALQRAAATIDGCAVHRWALGCDLSRE
jgi:hypothetical protein